MLTKSEAEGMTSPRKISPKQPWTRLVRFQSEQQIYYGEASPNFETANVIEGPVFGDCVITPKVAKIQKLLAPIIPSSVVAIGLNYQRHAAETKMPVPLHPIVFYKSNSSVTNPDDPIVLPKITTDPPQVDYEAELVIVIGKTCKNVTKEEALEYVAGYTAANDVSARKWQGISGGGQWCFGKSFDTFCPLGPAIISSEVIKNPNSLKIQSTLNGKVMQSSNTSDMIFDVPTLVAFLSQSTTLLPGTIILTGTPEGVGFTRTPPVYLQQGDVITIHIESIGDLSNPVVNESSAKL